MVVGTDTTTGFHLFYTYGTTSAPPSVAQLNALSAAVDNAYAARLSTFAHSSVSLTGAIATDLSSLTANQGSWAGSTPGGRAGTELPANCCTLINAHIQRRYRGGKPRVYPPFGVAGDLLNAQQFTATFLAALSAAWTNYISDLSTAVNAFGTGSGPVNINYFHKGEWINDDNGIPRWHPGRVTPPGVDPITGWTVSALVGSQRRRVRVG